MRYDQAPGLATAAPRRKRKRAHVASASDRRRARRRSLWPRPTAAARSWPVRYALTAYAVTAGVVLAVAVAARLAGAQISVGLTGPFVDLVLLGGLVPLYRSGRLTPRDLGFRLVPPARSVGLVLLALAAVVGAEVLGDQLIGPPTTGNPFSGIAQDGTLAIVFGAFAAAVSAPVVEEVFFRGLIYRSLRNRLPIAPAAILGALLFVAVHAPAYPPAALPFVAWFGLVACLLYERTGSLLPGIALHSLVDANAYEVTLTHESTIVLGCFVLLGLGLLTGAAFTTVRRRHLTRRPAAG